MCAIHTSQLLRRHPACLWNALGQTDVSTTSTPSSQELRHSSGSFTGPNTRLRIQLMSRCNGYSLPTNRSSVHCSCERSFQTQTSKTKVSDRKIHPVRGAKYCDEYVCLCVCPSVCTLASLEKHTSELHQIFVHVACSHESVLLWWRCDTLRTSAFCG